MAFKLLYSPLGGMSNDAIQQVNAWRMPVSSSAGLQPQYWGADQIDPEAVVTTSWSPAGASFGSRLGKFETQRLEVCQAAQSKFIDIARSEYFEYGYTAASEQYLLEFAKKYPGLVGELTQNIYLVGAKEKTVALALLNAVASLDYESVRPFGQTLALAALSNADVEVKEAAIRAYETWGHSEGAQILNDANCQIDWLDAYRKQVIADLGGVA